MSVRLDPEAIDSFAGDIDKTVEEMKEAVGRLGSGLSELGESWSDEKYGEFQDELDQLLNNITPLLENMEQHSSYLRAVAERAREVHSGL